MEKNTAVVISTYNGENFIKEQLDSIMNQSFQGFDLYIYDDGSTDRTVEILKEYERFGNVHILEGNKNLGYPQCFIHLLESVEGYRFYAFSDQDDVWNQDKLERAVKVLSHGEAKQENAEKKLPLLYYSSVEYCDAKLNFIRSSRFAENMKKGSRVSFQTLLFGGEAMGMTFVFNEEAKKALLKANEKQTFKDWFLKLYCALYGAVYYDPVPSAQYRRHEQAVTNQSNPAGGLARVFAQFCDVFIRKEGFVTQKKVIRHIYSECPLEELREKDREILQLFAGPDTLKNRIRKCFWKKRFRKKLIDEAGYRLAFLFGRI